MALNEDDSSGKFAQQRARANIVIARLAAGVFAFSGAAAAFFENVILAACFAAAAFLLFAISVVAARRYRRDHPGPSGDVVAFRRQAAPRIQRQKTSWLGWCGILLVASGITWAAMFFAHASRAAWTSTPDTLLGIICLVQALVGVLMFTHTRRTPPV